jgi:hypothetical protein
MGGRRATAVASPLQLTRHRVLQSSLVAFGYQRSATYTLPVSRLAAERLAR